MLASRSGARSASAGASSTASSEGEEEVAPPANENVRVSAARVKRFSVCRDNNPALIRAVLASRGFAEDAA